MSDPARDGFQCCGPMRPITLDELLPGTAAFLCDACLKWRHALPPDHPLRKRVVGIMQPMTQQLYRARKAADHAE